MSKLTLNIYFTMLKSGSDEKSEDIRKSVAQMYIKQFDFAQDLLGFFMCIELKISLKIWKAININVAKDYN